MLTLFRLWIVKWIIILIHKILLPRKYVFIADIVDVEKMFLSSSDVIQVVRERAYSKLPEA